jgi:GntR family transcriptional regulator
VEDALARISPVPLYFQVANRLQARIFSGAIGRGALLGTEKDLAVEFGVSRITIRRAIEILRRDGLVEAERGRGTFVSLEAQPVAPTALHVFFDDILARAEVLRVVEIDRAEVLADAEMAGRFSVVLHTRLVRLRRQMIPPDSDAGVWTTYFISLEAWRALDADARAGSLLPALDRTPGFRLTQGREVIRAIAADAETAALMDVPVGTPLLRLERDYQTAAGRTVLYGWADRTSGAIPVLLNRARR